MVADAPEEPWRPLSARMSDNPEQWDALIEGIPEHARESLRQWVADAAQRWRDLAPKAQRRLRLPGNGPKSLLASAMLNEDIEALDVLDACLRILDEWHKAYDESTDPQHKNRQVIETQFRTLQQVLDEASSAWTVGEDGLVRVVGPAAQNAFFDAVERNGDPAALLKEAWLATFRRQPDYDRAFQQAVFAVESVAAALFIPRDPRPTLGKANSHLTQTVDRWTVAGLDEQEQEPGQTLLVMLRTVWHNHERHVGQGGKSPEPATKDEAEAVLFLAVTLVQWFERGLVRRVNE